MALTPPVAFLSHASEDKRTVRILAEALMKNGVEVFFDEWEIGPGDSIRRRIDSGLGRCTHFVAVLTSTSIKKPWVNAELDAGYVRLIEGSSKFIPLRLGLAVSEIPPLMQGLHSPAIADPETDAVSLAGFMHGISAKPPLGRPPSAVLLARENTGLSPAAQAIARLYIQHSQQGRRSDPAPNFDFIKSQAVLTDEQVIDGIDELEHSGYVEKMLALGVRYFYAAPAMEKIFIDLDVVFGSNDPETDARRIAADLVNDGAEFASAHHLAETYGWEPRRLNPAMSYLVLNGLVRGLAAIDPQFSYVHLQLTPATRRFVQRMSR